ncbi:hypothetical protein GQX73_g1676 [Xylaria multiplex]|uniref:Enoyl reductase (ER) domain-containing protein n=1 Tax=Xylaria multiplex TaxID=323545 RepID=A0A7C8IW47_9PEZI|nr:hypothetical protein GQX73_g1676 [Xylaria multiplex]
MSLPRTFKQASFKEFNGPLVIEEVTLQLPDDGEILVKVEACGVCHSEVIAKYNAYGAGFPIVPGHEIMGKVAAVGNLVDGWNVGDPIAGCWHGGHDGTCEKCRQGLYQFCEPFIVNGITRNGGFGEYCIIRAQAAVRVPANMDPVRNAPMLCAGSTVFTALKAAGIKTGDTVAVQGLGGLGHMAVQFARKMGYRVIAISRGRSKEASIRQLGAHEYIDSTAGDVGEALKNLGPAQLVLTTALDTAAMIPLIKGIGIYGKLMILSFLQSGAMTIDSNELFMRGISIQSYPTGNCYDNQKTLEFAQMHGFDCVVEEFPLAKVQEAFDAVMNGKVRYRAVITMPIEVFLNNNYPALLDVLLSGNTDGDFNPLSVAVQSNDRANAQLHEIFLAVETGVTDMRQQTAWLRDNIDTKDRSIAILTQDLAEAAEKI